MALYDWDGYQGYSTAGILREHQRVNGTPTIVTGGRFGGKRLYCQATAVEGDYVARFVPFAPATLAVGFFLTPSNQLAAPIYLFEFQNADGGHLCGRLNADGSLSVLRGAPVCGVDFSGRLEGGTLLKTSEAGVLSSSIGASVQVKVTIDHVAGAVDIVVNGTNVLHLTDADTQNGDNATITNFLHGCAFCGPAATGVSYEDLVMATDLPGDMAVNSHFMTGDSAVDHAGDILGGDGSTEHYKRINEQPEPDNATTRVRLNAVDDADGYTHEALKTPGAAIAGVMVVTDCALESPGWGSVGARWRIGGVAHDAPGQGVGTGWYRIKTRYPTNPATEAAWEEAEFNGAELALRKTY